MYSQATVSVWTRQVPVHMRAVLSVIGEAEKAESGSGEAHRVRVMVIGLGCADLGCFGERRPKITSELIAMAERIITEKELQSMSKSELIVLATACDVDTVNDKSTVN